MNNSASILPAIFALFLMLSFSAGCQYIPKTQHVAEDQIEWSDGTVSEKGDKGWVDANGNGTASPVDATGKPNKPLLVDDVKKAEKLADKGKGLAEKVPAPFGWIVSLGVALAGGVGVMALKKRRAKQVADAGGKTKKS